MTPEQIYEFLESALPGDTLVYHTGYLARDRADMLTGKPKTHEQRHVDTIAEMAWSGMTGGKVFLVQSRVDRDRYEYKMLKRMERHIERRVARHLPRLSDDMLFGVR